MARFDHLPRFDRMPELMTRAQVAALAQVSERTVDRHIRAGKLEATKANGHVRIHRSAVRAWLTGATMLFLLVAALALYLIGNAINSATAMDALGRLLR